MDSMENVSKQFLGLPAEEEWQVLQQEYNYDAAHAPQQISSAASLSRSATMRSTSKFEEERTEYVSNMAPNENNIWVRRDIIVC